MSRVSHLEDLSPEMEVLLHFISPVTGREKITPGTGTAAEVIRGGFDRERLWSLARANGVFQLLCSQIKAAAPELMDANAEGDLRLNTARNFSMVSHLFRLLDAFEQSGIQAIPFKGPALAAQAYGSLAIRTYDDLDILIGERDLPQACEVMLANGYGTSCTVLDIGPAFTRNYDEIVFRGEGMLPLVEVHWKFVPGHFSVAVPMDDFRKRAGRVRLSSREIPALANEDMMLVLALHGSKHCWSHLGYITDVAWLATRPGFEWDPLLARAREIGAWRMVALAAALAGHLLKTQVPEPVSSDAAVADLIPPIVQALFGTHFDDRDIVRAGRMHVRMRERLRDRLRYTLRLAVRPGIEDWELYRLPQALSFMYPVLRVPRLLWKYRPRLH